MLQRKIDLVLITLVTLIFGILATSIVSFAGIYLVHKQEDIFVNRILTQVHTLTSQASSTLEHLNRTENIECNEDYLLYLRQVMFQDHYIKDIGLYDGENVVCITSIGILPQPIKKQESGIRTKTGNELIINSPLMLFNLDYSAFRMRSGRFFAVAEFKEIIEEDNRLQDWELVYNNNDNLISVLGTKGTFGRYSSGYEDKGSLTDSIVEQCLVDMPFCVLSRTKLLSNLNIGVIIILLLVFTFSCLFGFLLISRTFSYRYAVEQRIRRGIKCTNFFPLFQPIVDLDTDKIVGCEVLARFKDKQGSLFPDEFIPLLPKLNLTLVFTIQLIERAVAQLSSNPAIPNGFKININIYPSDITEENINAFMKAAKNDRHFNICFEITEDATFNTPDALANITRLRQSGFDVAIDDFGTGYANFGQLQNVEFDFLKIDRSFIMALEGDNIKSSLIPTIVSMAKQLNVTIVAEGIETEYQSAILKNLNAGLGQGWLYGKPMCAKDLDDLLKKHS